MTATPVLGVLLGSGAVRCGEIAAVARQAEASGFAELWASEDYFFTGGISTAAIALGATTSIKVGIGVAPIFTRHPGLAAMEASTLAGAFPGRFTMGIGTGVEKWLQQMGITHGKPLGAVREYVAALKGLAAGKTLSASGTEFEMDRIRLHEPHPFPIIVAAIGPRMVSLAGEISDGVILSVLSSPDYVRDTVARIRAEHPAAGERSIAVIAMFNCDENGDVARDAGRRQLGSYLTRVSPMTDALGISDEVLRRRAIMTDEEFVAAVPDEWVDAMTISGTPAECRAAIDRLTEAGATSVVLYLSAGGDSVEQIRSGGASLLSAP